MYIIIMLKTSAFQWCITQWYTPCIRTAPAHFIYSILVAMITHNFPSKWLPWQPKSCDMSTIFLLIRILNTVKIGLKLMKLQWEVALLGNIISNFSRFYLNVLVNHKSEASALSSSARFLCVSTLISLTDLSIMPWILAGFENNID